jgi:hypothetical protein
VAEFEVRSDIDDDRKARILATSPHRWFDL